MGSTAVQRVETRLVCRDPRMLPFGALVQSLFQATEARSVPSCRGAISEDATVISNNLP